MQVKTINIDASNFNDSLDNGEFPENLMEVIEGELERMRQEPGAAENAEIRLVLVNDFEPEEEEDEESDDETEPTKE